MRNKRYIKIVIGLFLVIMMLGTALFSVTAFASTSSNETVHTLSDFGSDIFVYDDSNTSGDSPVSDHSVDTSKDSSGFNALPWVGASFITKAYSIGIINTQLQRFSKDYIIKSYPKSNRIVLTSHNLFMQSNLACSEQTLLIHVSRLTAG